MRVRKRNALDDREAVSDASTGSSEEGQAVAPDTGNVAHRFGRTIPAFGSVGYHISSRKRVSRTRFTHLNSDASSPQSSVERLMASIGINIVSPLITLVRLGEYGVYECD